jgi:hypothetical protein
VGVGVTVLVGVRVGVGVFVAVTLAVGVIEGVTVGVTVFVGVGVGVLVGKLIVYGMFKPFILFTTIILVELVGITIGKPVFSFSSSITVKS